MTCLNCRIDAVPIPVLSLGCSVASALAFLGALSCHVTCPAMLLMRPCEDSVKQRPPSKKEVMRLHGESKNLVHNGQ